MVLALGNPKQDWSVICRAKIVLDKVLSVLYIAYRSQNRRMLMSYQGLIGKRVQITLSDSFVSSTGKKLKRKVQGIVDSVTPAIENSPEVLYLRNGRGIPSTAILHLICYGHIIPAKTLLRITDQQVADWVLQEFKDAKVKDVEEFLESTFDFYSFDSFWEGKEIRDKGEPVSLASFHSLIVEYLLSEFDIFLEKCVYCRDSFSADASGNCVVCGNLFSNSKG